MSKSLRISCIRLTSQDYGIKQVRNIRLTCIANKQVRICSECITSGIFVRSLFSQFSFFNNTRIYYIYSQYYTNILYINIQIYLFSFSLINSLKSMRFSLISFSLSLSFSTNNVVSFDLLFFLFLFKNKQQNTYPRAHRRESQRVIESRAL